MLRAWLRPNSNRVVPTPKQLALMSTTGLFLLYALAASQAVPWSIGDRQDNTLLFHLRGTLPDSARLQDTHYGAYVYHQGALIQVGHVKAVSQMPTYHVHLFDDLDFVHQDYPSGFYVPSTLLTLWKLQPNADQERLRNLVYHLSQDGQKTFRQMLESRVFRRHYLPRLRQVLNQSIQSLLQDHQFDEPLDEAMDEFLQTLSRSIIPVLPSIMPKVLTHLIKKSFTESVKDFLLTGQLDVEVFGNLVAEALKHPKLQAALRDALGEFLISEASMQLIERFVSAFVAMATQSSGLSTLIQDMATDADIVRHFQPLGDRAVSTVRQAAGLLLTTDENRRLDPIAAMVLKSLVFETDNSFLLLTNHEQSRRLLQQGFVMFERIKSP